ncbi:MAG: adenylyltransferase [Bacteroidota bacterium]|nr:adenylyltransferase [Bacteroidota bacterium]
MEVLFTPWRSQYIETFKEEDTKNKCDCFFCEAIESHGSEEKLLVVTRRKLCFVMLNKFPYNNGHFLIAPYRHVEEICKLTDDELSEIIHTVRDSTKVLEKMFCPHGFNVGANLGRVAGAGVPGHLHFHIVPRWNGDTSYMTVFADIKVVSQSLTETWKAASHYFNTLFK